MKAKRWMVLQHGTVTEVAITTPNGKRLKACTREEVRKYLRNPDGCKLYPVSYEMRITPTPHAGGTDA